MLKIDKVAKKVIVTGAKLFALGLGLKAAYKFGQFTGTFKTTIKLCTDDTAYDVLTNTRDACREVFNAAAASELNKQEGEDTHAECYEPTEPASEDNAEEA